MYYYHIVDITTSQDNKQTNDIVLLNEKIDEYFSKHTRMLAAINVNLTSINKRLSKLETNEIETPQNDALIKDFLPMKSVDNIKTFENVLHNSKDAASQFAALISKIGGNSPKNNIQRILLQIFDNSCATQCSWKGLRNNFGVSKLIAIKIMKDYIIATYPFFKADQFEVVIAEWFRFAKQRLHRETKES